MNRYLTIAITCLIASCAAERDQPEEATQDVQWVGAMSNVMHKGDPSGAVSLDTVDKTNLYGLGPTEGLVSEVMVMDGKPYVSTVVTDSTMKVDVKDVSLPFFVYAKVDNWEQVQLPDSIHTIKDINHFLDNYPKNDDKPFFFKVEGVADTADIHIVNLKEGSIIKSREDAHKDLKHFYIDDSDVTLLGVYSTKHAGVFIHHNTHTHIHLMTKDKKMMGHLESIQLKSGATIYIQDKQ